MAEWKSKSVPLTHPIPEGEGSDKKITAITLFEPDVEALEKIEDLGIEAGKKLSVKQIRGAIAAMSRLDDDVIKKLHRSDFEALGNEFPALFSGSAPTSGDQMKNGEKGTAQEEPAKS